MKKFSKYQIRWNEWVGGDDCYYLQRWVVSISDYAIRLHHWVSSDDQRHLHDHPWWMIIIVLKGSYTDISPHPDIRDTFIEDTLRFGSIRYRRAEHRHTVKLNSKDCWTFLITGKKVRNWGFYIPGRDALMRPLRYFKRFGHHQCD